MAYAAEAIKINKKKKKNLYQLYYVNYIYFPKIICIISFVLKTKLNN